MKRSLLVRGARQILSLRGPSGPRRGSDMRDLGLVPNGAMLVEDGVVTNIGPAPRIENLIEARKAAVLDVSGRVVLPGFVDSHTHLVHGGPRLDDFEMRIAGRTYAEIAAAGGGIATSVNSIRGSTTRGLATQAHKWQQAMAELGTTTVEVKSGYGLDKSSELKILRAAAALQDNPQNVVTTFLGAHAVPVEHRKNADAFLELVVSDWMPEVARRKMARFADIYCDSVAFSVSQARGYLQAARSLGFELKIHASQFANIGAVQLAVALGARSVDHLEVIGEPEIQLLASSPAIATLLPASVFHLRHRYPPARELIDAGAAVALATDFNPGTSPTPSMPMVLALACTQMRMTPAEAICAATINGAHALGLAPVAGSLEAGKPADFVVLDGSDYRELPYYFGVNPMCATFRRGHPVWHNNKLEIPVTDKP